MKGVITLIGGERVDFYGIGKVLIEVKMSELPEDVQKGIIEMYKNKQRKAKVTQDTENIVLCCEDIFDRNKLEKGESLNEQTAEKETN